MPKTETRNQILKFIEQNHPVRVKYIADQFKLSPQIIHRHLKKLLEDKAIIKKGSLPNIVYLPANSSIHVGDLPDPNALLEENWLTVLPDGMRLNGVTGFTLWCDERGFDPFKKYIEYSDVLKKYNRYRTNGWIDATQKFRDIFPEAALEKVFYLDFYSYEIFGKTKWGNLVLYAKLNEDKVLMDEVFSWAKPKIEAIVRKHNIEFIGFIPHSLKRKTPFLPNLKKFLNLSLPVVPLIKVSGEITVAQKTLKQSSERIQNARETIFLQSGFEVHDNKSLLLIDDAVGSGATLQETAIKCKKAGFTKIYGLALVGSIKGFEVIAEV